MAGIYIHIPFCKQACNYCNFHFTTSLRYKNELIDAILKEIELTSVNIPSVETIYFGGGTPSLFSNDELGKILNQISKKYSINPQAEITIEANPDDISKTTLQSWKQIGINRLSIGVQSFFDDDLQWMNRAHNALQAIDCIKWVKDYYNNFSIDLIYGLPITTTEKWEKNISIAIEHGIPHLSCYALTVEPQTPLHKQIRLSKKKDISAETQSTQFLHTISLLEQAGYLHYEISNFSKKNYKSQHNTSYWTGKTYLGIGPAAHSFDGNSRQWNVADNLKYVAAIQSGSIPFTIEVLTPVQKLNEYLMINLRTHEGIDLDKMQEHEKQATIEAAQKYIAEGKINFSENKLILTNLGKLFADGIAADLFFDE